MTPVVCTLLVCVSLIICVVYICNTISELHFKEPELVRDETLQSKLDEQATKEIVPVFDDVVRTVQNLLGGDDE